jgi:hypothetical protein
MSTLYLAGEHAPSRMRATMVVRVTDPERAPDLGAYLTHLGSDIIAGYDGELVIRAWESGAWPSARFQLESDIDSWVRHSRVPVQLS